MTSVDEFFNKQYGDSVAAMAEDEMMGLLKDLQNTRHWIAILKYLQYRRSVATGSLCTMDPVQNPTAIARTQGALSGLSDLEEMVYRLNNPVAEDDVDSN